VRRVKKENLDHLDLGGYKDRKDLKVRLEKRVILAMV
jgi:hypothetical protein